MWMLSRRDLSLIDVNNSALHIYGYDRQEFLKLPWRLIDPISSDAFESGSVATNRLEAEGAPLVLDVTIHPMRLGRRDVFIVCLAEMTGPTKEALDESEERYRRLVDLSPEGIAIHSEGLLVFANRAAASMLGAETPNSMIGRPVLNLVHPDYHGVVGERLRSRVMKGETAPLVEEKFIKTDGSVIDVEVTAMPFIYGRKPASLVIFHDITQRKRNQLIQTALYRIAEVTNSSKDMQSLYSALHSIIAELMYARNFYIALYDGESDILTFPYFCDEFDEPPEARRPGRGLTDYVLRTGKPLLASREVADELMAANEVDLIGTASIDWLGAPLISSGKTIGVLVVQSYSEKVRFGERERDLLTFVSQHIASALERKQAEETIYFQAYHDPLTHLPNRMLFQDRFLQALAHASRSGEILAMLFLDLDRFKTINDTLGHAMGDRLLQSVARRLKENLREGDTVARLGGDEFMIVVCGVRQIEDVATIADKLLSIIRMPFNFENHVLPVTTSIGISIYPYDGQDVEALIRNADIALYRAKEKGRNNYQLFTPPMDMDAGGRLNVR